MMLVKRVTNPWRLRKDKSETEVVNKWTVDKITKNM